MKKIIIASLCCALLVATVSCNKSNDIDSDKNTFHEELTDNTVTDMDNADNSFSNLNFYDMNSSYDSFYINRNPVAKWAITDDTKLCVYIPEWDEYHTFPFGFESTQDLINCVSVYENNGILINEAYYKDIRYLNVHLFSKGSDEIVECKINLDRTIHLSNLFCEFLDENNGYIFVFEEFNGLSAKGDLRLVFLFKTFDGGKTWTETRINNSPIVSAAEDPCIAEFIDDNIGIISCRYNGMEDMCKRTFFTSDGGKTWTAMSSLPCDFKGQNGYDATEIADFSYADGEYYLDVRVHTCYDDYYLKFKSSEFNSWILIK